ncbi:MAG: hypothetical protein QM813_17995 [Verrucomicrobiota bacterium]
MKTNRKRKWLLSLLSGISILVVAGVFYVRSRPLVFNESFFGHAHCIPQAGAGLRQYAGDHGGLFPTHTNGYGDALLLVLAGSYVPSYALTGPCYDRFIFDRALTNHADVSESECGRVYVQGLTETNNPAIAILFDKVPTPGGDHCHLLRRLRAALSRDVLLLDGSQRGILESEWSEFAKKQIELLVNDGYDRSMAEQLYAEKGKVR